jgi:hypothetical protein
MRSLWIAALIALAVYAVHSLTLGTWIIDDAGISYAYARNLVSGAGLVAQAQVAAVEGFTNLLWVVILAIPLALGLFDPIWTPKLLSGLCVLLAFRLIAPVLSAGGSRPWWLVTGALTITAATSGFAIWCSSGLENGLYALGIAALSYVCASEIDTTDGRVRRSALAGAILFCVFCTRPDGALYFWIPPFLFGLDTGAARLRRPLLAYLIGFIGPWLLLTLWRVVYFHDVMPNTFYAKQAEGSQQFSWLLEHLPLPLAGLVVAITGTAAMTIVAIGSAGLGKWFLRWGDRQRIKRLGLLLFFLTSIGVYHALRGDWMPEYRFATPTFLFGPAAVLAVVWDLASPRGSVGRTISAVFVLAALAAAGVYSVRITGAFARSPAIDFKEVCRQSHQFADLVAPAGPDATILTPDIGGALWVDRFGVVDLVGLIDRELGRAENRERSVLRTHLLDERQPDGVWLHGPWYQMTGFGDDPEFAALYKPVFEERPAPEAQPTSGFYLRRDLAR